MKDEAVSKRLHQIIEEEIGRKGPITFARFMEICLYHPEDGYYISGRSCSGREGDYYTSPIVHSIFGALLGRQVAQMWRLLGEGAFEIVEMGGGEGYLCHDLLDYLQKNESRLYDRLWYRMVEASTHRIERQRGFLAAFPDKVTWHRPEDISQMHSTGCFLSNELIDSFPVHRVVTEGGELCEVHVGTQDGGFKEVLQRPSTPELEGYFRRLGVSLAEGQRAEVNLEALRWLQGVAQGLQRGFVITIDYGYPAPELFAPHRNDGTLLCYRDHRISTDPYRNVGLQDMTSHVDFTSLIRWGEEWGLRFAGLVHQYRFLLALGVIDEMERLGEGKSEEEAQAERLAIKNLILPGGMGDTFHVLIQHKGVEYPHLDGLKDFCTEVNNDQ